MPGGTGTGGAGQNTGLRASNNSTSQQGGSNTVSVAGSGSAATTSGPMYMPIIPGMTCHVIGQGPAAVTSTGAMVIDDPEALGVNALTELIALPNGSSSPAQLAALRRSFAQQIGKEEALDESALEEVLDVHNEVVAAAPMPVAPVAPALGDDTGNHATLPMPANARDFLKNWVKHTTKGTWPLTSPRSNKLQAVDRAVAAYLNSPTLANLQNLAKKVLAWQKSKDNWELSIRASAVKELVSFLENEHLRLVTNQLTSNPNEFLKKNMFTVAGRSHGVHDFYLNAPGMSLSDLADEKALRYTMSNIRGGPPLRMASVGMTQLAKTEITDEATRQAVRQQVEDLFYPIPDDVDMLTTGQITGCLFITRTNPVTGKFECAHIQPNIKVWATGEELEAYVKSLGLGNDVVYYGRDEYLDASSVTIVGTRENNTWTLRYQKTGMVDNESGRRRISGHGIFQTRAHSVTG